MMRSKFILALAITISGCTIAPTPESREQPQTTKARLDLVDTDSPPPPIPVIQLVAGKQNFPRALAVSGNNVYWVNGGTTRNDGGSSVMSAPKDGFEQAQLPEPTMLSHDPNRFTEHATGIAVDGVNVYWIDDFDVRKVPIGGGATTVLYKGKDLTLQLAQYGQSLYWTGAGGLLRVSITGGAATGIRRNRKTWGLAVDPLNTVFWGEYGNSQSGWDLLSSPAPRSWDRFPTVLENDPFPIRNVTTAGDRIYWSNGRGDILSCKPVACGVTLNVLVGGSGRPSVGALATDGTNMYFTNNEGGFVMKCALTGCLAPTVVAGLTGPSLGIAVDADWIYWTDMGGRNGVVTAGEGYVARIYKH